MKVKIQSKKCTKCRIVKPLTEFHALKSARDGKKPSCKSCRNMANRKYVQENREAIREKARSRLEEFRKHNPPKTTLKSIEEVMCRIKEVHGELYDYSKFLYKGMNVKSTIICRDHGEFKQVPSSHIRQKAGCPECSRLNSRLTQEEALKVVKDVHGDKYDYSNYVYNGSMEKINVICPTHGVFETTHNRFSRGSGCQFCARQAMALSQEESIRRAKEIHGDRYDYSQWDYKTFQTSVKIICRDHGVFETTPAIHFGGSLCPKCVIRKEREFSTEQAMSSYKKTHGNRYDYSQVKYKNQEEEIIVICKSHGPFSIRPSYHKQGKGCSKCRELSVRRKQLKWVRERHKFGAKACNKCETVLSLSLFYNHSKNPDGKAVTCKLCVRKRGKTYRENNADLIRGRHRRWKKQNRVHSNKVLKAYRKNPIAKIRHTVSVAVRTAIKRVTNGKGSKGGKTFDMLPYTPQELVTHLESLFEDGMSWETHGKWHIDHVIPQAYFKYDSLAHPHFKECWALENLRPLWAQENMKKGSLYEGRRQKHLKTK